jgi:hypothetical protein
MIERRPFADLGGADHGWLKARHHFSFANYYDPKKMGWGPIRVWNDDEIAPQSGFPPHPHADMEIVTYVRKGAITHKDSLGNEGRTEAGDVQVMSAGSGIRHAEYNLEAGPTTLFQIWIEPSTTAPAQLGLQPFPKVAGPGVRHLGQRPARRRRSPGFPIRHRTPAEYAECWAGETPEHVRRVNATGRPSGRREVNGVRLRPDRACRAMRIGGHRSLEGTPKSSRTPETSVQCTTVGSNSQSRRWVPVDAS